MNHPWQTLDHSPEAAAALACPCGSAVRMYPDLSSSLLLVLCSTSCFVSLLPSTSLTRGLRTDVHVPLWEKRVSSTPVSNIYKVHAVTFLELRLDKRMFCPDVVCSLWKSYFKHQLMRRKVHVDEGISKVCDFDTRGSCLVLISWWHCLVKPWQRSFS